MADPQSIMRLSEHGAARTDHNESDLGRSVLRFFMHCAFAVVGGMVVGFVLLSLIHMNPVGPHWRLITFFVDVPYSPAFWGAAMLLGFFVNQSMGDRSALWVGPAGLILLAAIVLISISEGEQPGYELVQHQHYFFLKQVAGELFGVDPKLCGGNECLGKLLFTVPALSSVSYSLGAFLGLRMRPTPLPN